MNTRSPLRTWSALLMGLATGWAPSSLRAQWVAHGETGAVYDDNPGNAADRDATVPVSGAFAAIDLTQVFYLTDRLSLRVGGRIRGEVFNRAEGLNQASFGVDGALRRKWGIGPGVPWTELALSATREEYREELRRGWRYRGALRGGKRLGDRVDVWADLWAERRVAKEGDREEADLSGDAFSQSNVGYTLQTEIGLSSRWFLTLAYLHRHGDATLSSTEEADDYPQAKAAAVDPTFGPGFFAYKINATAYGGRAAITYAYSDRAAFVLAFERQVTTIDGPEIYGRNLSTLTFKFSF